MSPFPVRALLVALVGAGLASCDRGMVGPESQVRGVYNLRRVDAQPLPMALWTENGQTLWLLAETLRFDGAGNVTRAYSWRRDSLGTAGEPQTLSLQLQYRVRAHGLDVGSFAPCPPNALCVAPDTGFFALNLLWLDSHFYFGRRLSYQLGREN